jgi:acyl-CoA thioesterase II
VRIVGDVDLTSSDASVAPAEMQLWLRHAGAPDDLTTSQAIVSWATDGYLIGTAMRPHAGIGQDQAHRTISTGVVSEALSFHRPFDVKEWLMFAHESPFAGGGRAYGRAHVFDASGALVASFAQESIVRAMPAHGER